MAQNSNNIASMNTQERMDEALDQFNESADAGKTTTQQQQQHQHKKKHRSSQRKESKGRQRNLSKNESLKSLTPLPEPTKRGKDESAMESNWGMNDVESTQVNNGGRKVRQYRMTIVGYSRVGKSALCSRFCDNVFKNDHPKHKELLFKKIIDLPEMPTYRFFLDILDTQGAQEVKNREIVMEDRYRKRTNHIMLFVFSLTNDKSYRFIEELLRIEYEQDQEYFERMGVVIVGNKNDLKEDREVETTDARDLARDYGAKYFETSAKTGQNVELAFYEAVRKYHEKRGEMEETMEDANKQHCCHIL